MKNTAQRALDRIKRCHEGALKRYNHQPTWVNHGEVQGLEYAIAAIEAEMALDIRPGEN